MNTFAQRFKEALLCSGIQRKELALMLNVTKSTISNYENGYRTPDYDTLYRLAEIFGVSVDFLLGTTTVPNGEVITPVVFQGRVPILGTVPCGEPIEAIETILGYVDVPKKMEKDHFALYAKGDSMAPKIEDKDIIIIHQTCEVTNGKIAIVKVNGEEATCKKLSLHDDTITLIPLNPNYDPVTYSSEEALNLPITIIGEVVEVRKKL